jgi:hypothetical protein
VSDEHAQPGFAQAAWGEDKAQVALVSPAVDDFWPRFNSQVIEVGAFGKSFEQSGLPFFILVIVIRVPSWIEWIDILHGGFFSFREQ